MDSPQRPCLPDYPCLMALVCDLQSMFHKTPTSLSSLINTMHSLVGSCSVCRLIGPGSSEEINTSPGPFLSQRSH